VLLLTVALCFGVSATPITIANSQLTIEEVASIGGGTPVVALAGSYAYVGEGGGLTVLDIRNPGRFVRRAHLRLADQQHGFSASAIQPVGNRVYIGSRYGGGLATVDVSDPSHPVLLGRYTGPDVTFLAVADDRAYILQTDPVSRFDQSRLYALDMTAPAQPVLLWTSTWMPSPANQSAALAAADGRLYLSDSQSGLKLFDVQSASGPTLLGTYAVAGIRGIAVAGDLAYLATSGSGLQIVDIHDPAHPTLLGSYDTPMDTYNATRVRVEGNRAYVAATYAGFAGVQTLDVSDPAHPALLGGMNGVQGLQEIQVAGGWVSALSASDWQLIDWRTAAHAVPHGRYPVIAYAEDIEVQAGRAYIASEYGGGLQIVDISAPESLMQIGSYAQIYASSLEVRDNLAYVTDPIANGGLHIIDISTVSNPVRIGHFDNWYREWDVQLVGDLAYVAAEKDGLLILDVSDPVSPTLRGANTTPENTAYLHIEGQVAYALDNRALGGSPNVFYTMDIADPSNPAILGSYEDSATIDVARGMDVANNIAYIPTGQSLQMLDVSDPARPTRRGSYNVPSWGVRVIGTRAYVTTSSGLDIVDVSDPLHPALLGSYTGPAAGGNRIEVVGDLIYITAGWSGLHILRVLDSTGSATPTSTRTSTPAPAGTPTVTASPTAEPPSSTTPTPTATVTAVQTATPAATASPTIDPTTTPTQEIDEDPGLTINYSTGMPGSAFTIRGSRFRPGAQLRVGVNGTSVGELTANTAGAFTLILDTAPAAAPGAYDISVAETQPAALGTTHLRYTLNATAPLRERESLPGAFELAVPTNIHPVTAHVVYLPILRR
jgi:hypothetical protein